MELTAITEKLKTDYIQIVKKFETTIDLASASISIPKVVAPYLFHFHDLLKEYSKLNDQLEELFHQKMFNIKIQNDALSVVDFNASELKKMVETSPEYRKLNVRLQEIKNDMKIIEEMIGNIKGFSFNVNNAIKYRELTGA